MSGPFFIASVHASFGEYPDEFFRACLRPSLAVSRPRGDFAACELLALGSGKPDEGSTLNQVPTPRVRHWLPVPVSQSDHNQMRGLPNLQRTVGGVAAKTFFAHSHGGIAHFSRG